jgi:hypothetical protein
MRPKPRVHRSIHFPGDLGVVIPLSPATTSAIFGQLHATSMAVREMTALDKKAAGRTKQPFF